MILAHSTSPRMKKFQYWKIVKFSVCIYIVLKNQVASLTSVYRCHLSVIMIVLQCTTPYERDWYLALSESKLALGNDAAG